MASPAPPDSPTGSDTLWRLKLPTATATGILRDDGESMLQGSLPALFLSMGAYWYDNTITNAYGNSCVYLQIGETCVAGRHIGSRDGSYSGAFSRVM
jgi:hypothetical protein